MSRERGRPFNPLFPYLFAFIGGWYFCCSWLHMHIEGAVQSSVAPYKGQCTLPYSPLKPPTHPLTQHQPHRVPSTLQTVFTTPITTTQLRFMFDCSICRDFPDVFVSRPHSPGRRTLTPLMSLSCFYWSLPLIELIASTWHKASFMVSMLWFIGEFVKESNVLYSYMPK